MGRWRAFLARIYRETPAGKGGGRGTWTARRVNRRGGERSGGEHSQALEVQTTRHPLILCQVNALYYRRSDSHLRTVLRKIAAVVFSRRSAASAGIEVRGSAVGR